MQRDLQRSLGTLGGGNHFIEIDEAADGTKVSRNSFRQSEILESRWQSFIRNLPLT